MQPSLRWLGGFLEIRELVIETFFFMILHLARTRLFLFRKKSIVHPAFTPAFIFQQRGPVLVTVRCLPEVFIFLCAFPL